MFKIELYEVYELYELYERELRTLASELDHPFQRAARCEDGEEVPALVLEDSEAYMNHKFTDGREKTVLCGFIFHDDRNDQTYMQDRAVWTKPQGKGQIVYIKAGHGANDFEKPVVRQMIVNAVRWDP